MKVLNILPLLFVPYISFASCNNIDSRYSKVCTNLVKSGVSSEYINTVFDSEKITQQIPSVTKSFSVNTIQKHNSNEKKANINLLQDISTLINHLEEFKEVYDLAESKLHVNREIIAATLFKETKLGKIHPKFDSFTVFNTLLLTLLPDSERNMKLIKMAENNLSSLIKVCYLNGTEIEKCDFKSSYAGAIGIPQFMPANLHLAVSYSGQTPDIHKMEDAIMSCANFYNKNANYKKLIDFEDASSIQQATETWHEFSSSNTAYKFYSKDTNKCFSCSNSDFAQLNPLVNKILAYNNSSEYALGVIQLAYKAHITINSNQKY